MRPQSGKLGIKLTIKGANCLRSQETSKPSFYKYSQNQVTTDILKINLYKLYQEWFLSKFGFYHTAG